MHWQCRWKRLVLATSLAGAAVGLGACTSPSAPPAAAAMSQAPDYVIGPGDTLSIFVYRAPELSTPDLPVRPDGRLSIPLVPDVVAAGSTPTQLAHTLEQRLRTYVREPNVTVMVRTFVGPPNRQIRVIGEATRPLAIPYREGLSLLDVMIEARGLTRFAAGNRAAIIRRVGASDARQSIPVRLSDLMLDGDIAQDLPMQAGDTLIIPQSWF